MKKSVSVLIFILLCGVILGVYTVFGDESDEAKCRDFLASYGWAVSEKATDFAEITVPNTFDRVYGNYNELQKTSGLDISPYRGKTGKRYTFTVLNYPSDVGEPVYANVIIIDGVAIAGDIMTVSLSGFMHGVAENTPK